MRMRATMLAAVVLAAALAGCAAVPQDPQERADFEATNDPLEPMNRAVFAFNTKVDEAVMQPVARAYRATLPDPAQRAVHRLLDNLRSPLIFANDVLQGQARRAGDTVVRFLVNSTAGLGGLFEVVGNTGGPSFHDEDFGQTLAVWGVGEGPYLVLPFLGPSNPRDAVGLGVEFAADPTDLALANQGLAWATWSRLGVGAVDTRAGLLDPIDDLKRSSLDFYAAMRSVYRQRRANDIANKDIPAADVYRKGAAP